jgi:ribose/xylose/arabinose/galactoside ABC-type transport system permease subunit
MKKVFMKLFSKLPKINYREIGILYALILLWVIFILTNENFRKPDNFLSIIREASFVGVAAIGMTFCIISGAFDLSVGYMLPLLMLVILSIVGKVGLLAAIVIILLLGALCGTVNGLLVAKMRLPAFIATLAMYYIYMAIGLIYSGGKPIRFQEPWFTVIGNGDFMGLPIPFMIMIALTILGTVILRRTPLGRHILAVGNSEKASYISGINISRTKIIIFALVGIFTAASAILVSSRLWSAEYDTKANVGFEFQVITAVVLGGTSLAGGKGSVFNTVIAAIFLTSINTGLNMFQVASFKQKVIEGVILLLAFSLTGVRQLIEEKLRTRKRSKSVITG